MLRDVYVAALRMREFCSSVRRSSRRRVFAVLMSVPLSLVRTASVHMNTLAPAVRAVYLLPHKEFLEGMDTLPVDEKGVAKR